MMTERKTDDASYNALPFPMKLHGMLEDAERLQFVDIVSWLPGGKSFKVFEPSRFQNEIMNDYFNQTKFKSFQRQLNIYGFKRIQTGHNKGGYIHKNFVRGVPELSESMTRKAPSSKILQQQPMVGMACVNNNNKLNFEPEPITIYGASSSSSMGHCKRSRSSTCNADRLEIFDSEVKPLFDFFFPEDPSEKEMVSSLFHLDCQDYSRSAPLFPSSSSSSRHERFESLLSLSNLNDEDFCDFLPMLEESVSNQNDEIYPLVTNTTMGLDIDNDDDDECDREIQQQVEELSFPWKLHLLLENAKKEQYQHIVSWVGDGKAFKVHDTKQFVSKIMPNYFDQTKYESFRRQLNLYGFSRISKGQDRGIISHPKFMEGCQWMCNEVCKA